MRDLNRFFYRISDFDLTPGNKTAGFVLSTDPLALSQLSHLPVTPRAQQEVTDRAIVRAERANLGTPQLRKAMCVHFQGLTAVPTRFSALWGSVGADPDALLRIQEPGFVQAFRHGVEYTPHNVDAPVEGLLLMLLVQTWGEWATDTLLFNSDHLALIPPPLAALPSYGDHMPLSEFQACTSAGALIPDDGTGYFATKSGVSELDCFGDPPSWATHVVWFNK